MKIFEGDVYAQRIILQNLICLFQDDKMMEDESIRSYNGKIFEIVAGIRSHGGTKLDDEVI